MLGIFDSGIGGLTVVQEIKKRNPAIPLIYFGDTARVPWGNKSQALVQQYSSEVCDFLVSEGADEIVIACNTASAMAGDYLRWRYPNVAIHDVISPVIERVRADALKQAGLKVGLIGTKGTIASGTYERKIKEAGNGVQVFSKACPLFVPLVEEGWLDNQVTIQVAQQYIQELLDNNIQSLILGCTHYPLLKDAVYKVVGDQVNIISSAEEVAKRFQAVEGAGITEAKDTYFFSDWNGHDNQLISQILGREIAVNVRRLD